LWIDAGKKEKKRESRIKTGEISNKVKLFFSFMVVHETTINMKKIIALLVMICTIGLTAFAQETVKKDKSQDKVKKTSTLGEKAHNTFSKHKRYNGYKVKHKSTVNGHTVKTKKKVENDKH
jgi:hypothetical protein